MVRSPEEKAASAAKAAETRRKREQAAKRANEERNIDFQTWKTLHRLATNVLMNALEGEGAVDGLSLTAARTVIECKSQQEVAQALRQIGTDIRMALLHWRSGNRYG